MMNEYCTDVAFIHVNGKNSKFYNCTLDILYRIDPEHFDVCCGIIAPNEPNAYSKNQLDIIFEMTYEEVCKHIVMEIM